MENRDLIGQIYKKTSELGLKLIKSEISESQLLIPQFIQARLPEIQHMIQAMDKRTEAMFGGSSPSKQRSKRVFQRLPRHLRRRNMSKNLHLLPRNYRALAFQENVDQPKIVKKRIKRKTRRRMREREDLLFSLIFPAFSPKKPENQAESSEKKEFSEVAVFPEEEHSKILKNKEKRLFSSHIFQAKRFHMFPKWNHMLPIFSTQKVFRIAYRFLRNHSTIFDSSFWQCFQIYSKDESKILQFLSEISRKKLQFFQEDKLFRQGGTEKEFFMMEVNNNEEKILSPVKVLMRNTSLESLFFPKIDKKLNSNSFLTAHVSNLKLKPFQIMLWFHPAALFQCSKRIQELCKKFDLEVENRNDLARFELRGLHALSMFYNACNGLLDEFQDEKCLESFEKLNKMSKKKAQNEEDELISEKMEEIVEKSSEYWDIITSQRLRGGYLKNNSVLSLEMHYPNASLEDIEEKKIDNLLKEKEQEIDEEVAKEKDEEMKEISFKIPKQPGTVLQQVTEFSEKSAENNKIFEEHEIFDDPTQSQAYLLACANPSPDISIQKDPETTIWTSLRKKNIVALRPIIENFTSSASNQQKASEETKKDNHKMRKKLQKKFRLVFDPKVLRKRTFSLMLIAKSFHQNQRTNFSFDGFDVICSHEISNSLFFKLAKTKNTLPLSLFDQIRLQNECGKLSFPQDFPNSLGFFSNSNSEIEKKFNQDLTSLNLTLNKKSYENDPFFKKFFEDDNKLVKLKTRKEETQRIYAPIYYGAPFFDQKKLENMWKENITKFCQKNETEKDNGMKGKDEKEDKISIKVVRPKHFGNFSLQILKEYLKESTFSSISNSNEIKILAVEIIALRGIPAPTSLLFAPSSQDYSKFVQTYNKNKESFSDCFFRETQNSKDPIFSRSPIGFLTSGNYSLNHQKGYALGYIFEKDFWKGVQNFKIPSKNKSKPNLSFFGFYCDDEGVFDVTQKPENSSKKFVLSYYPAIIRLVDPLNYVSV